MSTPSRKLAPIRNEGDDLTEEQQDFARKCFERWLDFRAAFGPKRRDVSGADIGHSALLGRLLEGKAPFEFPPPCAHSYPWYRLAETGWALAYEVGPAEYPETPEGPAHTALVVDQAWWKILDADPDLRIWVVSHDQEPDAVFRVFAFPSTSPCPYFIERLSL